MRDGFDFGAGDVEVGDGGREAEGGLEVRGLRSEVGDLEEEDEEEDESVHRERRLRDWRKRRREAR